MKKLILILALIFVLPTRVNAQTLNPEYEHAVIEYAEKEDIDQYIVLALIEKESNNTSGIDENGNALYHTYSSWATQMEHVMVYAK